MQLLWDTWSGRETKIDELAMANAKLYEDIARYEDSTYPEPARRELSKTIRYRLDSISSRDQKSFGAKPDLSPRPLCRTFAYRSF